MTGRNDSLSRRTLIVRTLELSAAGVVTAFAWGTLGLRDAKAQWMPGRRAHLTERPSFPRAHAADAA